MACLVAKRFGSCYNFPVEIQCTEWCPKKDVVAFLDIHGELQVLRVWEFVRKWSSAETGEADMVVWNPEGMSLTTINSKSGLLTTFEVEAQQSHSLTLDLCSGEQIASCRWETAPAFKNRTSIQLLNAIPRTDSFQISSTLDNSLSLLTLTTNFARTIVILNGCFIVSDLPARDDGFGGLFSWISYDNRSAMTLHSLIKEHTSSMVKLVSFAFENTASIYPDLANVSVLMNQLRRLVGTINSHTEAFQNNADAFQAAQSELSSEISTALKIHGSEPSPAEFLKKLLLGCSTIDILSQLASDSPKKKLKRAANIASMSYSSAILDYMSIKTAAESLIYVISELRGISLRSAWRQSKSQSDKLLKVTEAVIVFIERLSKIKQKLDQDSTEFALFVNWILNAAGDSNGEEETPATGMHRIIFRYFQNTIKNQSDDLPIQTLVHDISLLSQMVLNQELLCLYPDTLDIKTIIHHSYAVDIIAINCSYFLFQTPEYFQLTSITCIDSNYNKFCLDFSGKSVNILSALFYNSILLFLFEHENLNYTENQPMSNYTVGYVNIADISHADHCQNSTEITKIKIMFLFSCKNETPPVAMQINSARQLLSVCSKQSVIEVLSLEELDDIGSVDM